MTYDPIHVPAEVISDPRTIWDPLNVNAEAAVLILAMMKSGFTFRQFETVIGIALWRRGLCIHESMYESAPITTEQLEHVMASAIQSAEWAACATVLESISKLNLVELLKYKH